MPRVCCVSVRAVCVCVCLSSEARRVAKQRRTLSGALPHMRAIFQCGVCVSLCCCCCCVSVTVCVCVLARRSYYANICDFVVENHARTAGGQKQPHTNAHKRTHARTHAETNSSKTSTHTHTHTEERKNNKHKNTTCTCAHTLGA